MEICPSRNRFLVKMYDCLMNKILVLDRFNFDVKARSSETDGVPMKSFNTQVTNKIIFSGRGGKWSLICNFSAVPLFLLQTAARDDVRQEQLFFGSDRRMQMTNGPIIVTLLQNEEDIGKTK